MYVCMFVYMLSMLVCIYMEFKEFNVGTMSIIKALKWGAAIMVVRYSRDYGRQQLEYWRAK